MAVFIHPRALANATPVCFRPDWVGVASPASPPTLVASWAIDADRRLVRRWRPIASPTA